MTNMTKKMLLSNDDGIHAPGLRALFDAVRDLGAVRIAAPCKEQSAVGHGITVFDPIKSHEVFNSDGSLWGYAVHGTPADCVKLAVNVLLASPPNLVLSGVNLGANQGIGMVYSGTVSAAVEGAISGIPSIAFSIDAFQSPNWDTARWAARVLVKKVMEQGMPEGTVLNVNIPNLPREQVRGFAATSMARSRFKEIFHQREDPRGRNYYWLDGTFEVLDQRDDSDIQAVNEGYVSITPIGLDLTRHDVLETLKNWDFADSES